ncbi:similar to Saccharomyces cerevisiae YJL134W LCB3 Long-chain base-1-phosphate phosphatase with specificity for dihydrosphingosine-1-phosphate [Maudiozyma saulgeensis]|uniref:Similar to Saccharomyces cerevisiae YJL134W LCB3 Long-chain base-1-phosphate phosphatase with specificity for dihydrosphingosine-1-phosphate n=1 Tax=Maudiozyma saulgeensis TaxID=1789683 RepID=A0A1X7R0Y5_9SACH|nr:similar to Saccharomyces cerevisiae YJL134W LCB3 Long-chain base-1-phosphate phosphatase with specificity for dihydrosphingosine-1-phosphate [Kazachstania saulgeensis]
MVASVTVESIKTKDDSLPSSTTVHSSSHGSHVLPASKSLLVDPGNHPDDHFKSKMSPLRFHIRKYLTQFTNHQSIYLSRWQNKSSTKFRDLYFLYTALLGSHTFYVLFLPMPVWFGYFETTRDLVYLLGYSIYLSGFLKDYWCLPRPQSPPVERVSLSPYTTEEYGAPSSHSANATAVTLYFLVHLYQTDNSTISMMAKCGFTLLILFYYATLVLGRLYCGMHGLLDIITGSLCGIITYIIRMWLRNYFTDFESGSLWWFPIVSFSWGLFILFKHVRPIDECPCFGDSVAFIGVASGYECGDWFLQQVAPLMKSDNFTVDGPKVFLRPFVAVPMVLIWKSVISKPLVYNTLIKIVHLKDDRLEKSELRIKYKKLTEENNECAAHIGEANIDIVARYIIYMGIPITVTVACPYAFTLLGL